MLALAPNDRPEWIGPSCDLMSSCLSIYLELIFCTLIVKVARSLQTGVPFGRTNVWRLAVLGWVWTVAKVRVWMRALDACTNLGAVLRRDAIFCS